MLHMMSFTLAMMIVGMALRQASRPESQTESNRLDARSSGVSRRNTGIQKHLRIIEHLYEVDGLTLAEIGRRLGGITRQAIHQVLIRNGVKLRPRSVGRLKVIDRETLYRLYVTEGLGLSNTAKALKTRSSVVERELQRHDFEIRPKYHERRSPTAIDDLKIGDAVVIESQPYPKPYCKLYSLASARKVRISIRRIDPDRVRVTRIE
jgi:hypothetical protein